MFRACRLDDIVAVVNDKTSFEKNQMLPYIGLEHLRQRGAGLNGSSRAAESISVNTIFKAGDVLFGKLRPNLRKSALAPFDGYCSTDILVLRPKSGISSRFAAKVFQSDRVGAAAEMTAGGTKMPRTSWNALRALEVYCPAFESQESLADVLDTLDTTIRHSEVFIEKLKLVKQGLLHDLLTRGIDANSELRPPQSQAPHLYKDSPLGWIPKEWSAGPLSDWLDGKPKNGYSPQEAGRWTGSQMLGLGCLTPTGFQARQLKNAPAGDVLLKPALLMDGDLLISRANTRDLVGLVGIYRDVGTPCHYPDLMMRLTPAVQTSAEFLELVLSAPRARRQIQSRASGTSSSMVKISGATVATLCVAIPTFQEQVRIFNMLRALNNQLEREVQFNEAQQAVKSGLMDDLLTGRVRVTPLLDSARAPT